LLILNLSHKCNAVAYKPVLHKVTISSDNSEMNKYMYISGVFRFLNYNKIDQFSHEDKLQS